MDIIYQIDIEKNGQRIGGGPITSVISWESQSRLGEVGDFSCKIAATDEQINYIAPYVTLVCYAFIQTVGMVEIGRGEIRDIKTSIDPEGTPIIEAKGPDGVNRLTEKLVGYLEIGIVEKDVDGTSTTVGNPISLIDALKMVEAEFKNLELQPGTFPWSFNYDQILDVTNKVSYQFAGETVLAALAKLCELSDTHFIVNPGNKVIFRKNTDFDDCGVRAIASPPNPDPLNQDTCYIVGTPTISEETGDTYTRVIPWGYGRAEKSIGLHHLIDADPKNLTPRPPLPSGYDWVNDPKNPTLPLGVRNIAAETPPASQDAVSPFPGRVIEKFRKLQDIEPVLPDDLDGTKPDSTEPKYTDDEQAAIRIKANRAAAQTLLDAALRDLNEAVNRTVHYDLSILHLNNVVKPGQKIHCIFFYRSGSGWAPVDQWLNITAARLIVNSEGIRTTDLTVSTVSRPPRLDADPLLKLIAWQNRFGGRIT